MKVAFYHQRGTAFTIVELLAAMAVLVLLLSLVMQILGHTFRATHTVQQQISATQQTRAVLDALESDLANLIVENGLTIFTKSSGSNGDTVLAFLTRSRGPAGAVNFRFMGVAYELVNHEMRRRSLPVSWNDKNLVDKAVGAAAAQESSILARGILRFEAVAVLQNGDTVSLVQSSHREHFGQPVPEGYLAIDLRVPPASSPERQVVALTVAVAAVDQQNLGIPGVADMGKCLPSPTVGKSPLQTWKEALASGELGSIPRPALAALRMTQKTYVLR